jgi:hypothetical protein
MVYSRGVVFVIAGSEGRLNILFDIKLERKIWTSLT